ncbi:hypothetical protein ACLI4U_17315 [Natrialbaceae archaeon A-CW2]|uniref:DUF7344 domain-containing protein n=1 Tax=Natronosalvus amylolyticus TaxID=2961994 RepID=UPI0020C98C38|nr:hypothetical protein [Natronosalvus amylolyticus]
MVEVDAVLELLGAQRRRYALYFLEEQSEPVPIEAVAEAVAAMEAAGDDAPGPADVKVSLHHNHLQKAGEYEFIQYDSEKGVVELLDSPPQFDLLLTVANVLEQPE